MKFLLVSILIFTSTLIFSNEQMREIGKIELDTRSNNFLFYFIKENKIKSVLIHPKSKEEFLKLNNLKNKVVILAGEIKVIINHNEGFTYKEEVDHTKILELNKELLKINHKKIMTQYNLVSHEKNKNKIEVNVPTFSGTDKTANSIITVAGAIIGVAVGPMAIIPASIYLLNERITK
jgi:hypothetical protein